ncbi:MAG: tetratricopeptide repeat protein, partial [bacterium]|nr:tetratricopeptide repeat protein [bacterium]
MPERRKFPTLIRKLPLLGLLAWALCLGSGSQGWAQSTTELDAIYFKARQSSDEAQIRQALGQLQNALAKRPTASLRTQAGYLYLRLENPDSARTLFEQAILRDSTQVGAHTGLGWVLLEYKDSPRSALAHLEAAVAIDSTHAETLYYLARAYLRTSKTTRARRSADAAIRHNP